MDLFRYNYLNVMDKRYRLTSALTNTSPLSVRRASTGYVNFGVLGVHSSLDTESAATLVHAFVASRIDNCNAILAGAPKATTEKLQRVLNAAARVVSGTLASSTVAAHS